MPLKISTIDAFRAAAKDGATLDAGVMHTLAGAPAVVNEDRREIRYVFSDGSLDLAGDTIDPQGWDLDQFNRNPVALWSHMAWDPPIGAARNVGVTGGKLMGTINFATAEEYAFADTIYRLAAGGYINAVSVGFLPMEWSFTSDKDRPFGIDFKRQTLLEISLCPVPCNGNALQEARSAGIDTGPIAEWAQRVLDGEGSVLVPRSFLEETFRAAKTPKSLRHKYLAPESRAQASEWRVGAAHNLPIDTSDVWDGAASAARMFTASGFDGDEPDYAAARRGFLIYDAANPSLRASYKLPFADFVGGELKAVGAGIRAAASRLPQTDAPQAVLDDAKAVLDGYEKSLNEGKSVTRAGRRISAESEAKIKEAMDHHAAATACLRSVLDGTTDDGDSDPPGDDDPGDIHDPMDEPAMPDPMMRARVRRALALKQQADAL